MCQPTHGWQSRLQQTVGWRRSSSGVLRPSTLSLIKDYFLTQDVPTNAGRTQLGDFEIFISAAKSVKQPTVMVGAAAPGVTSGQTDGTVGVKLQGHYIWPTTTKQTTKYYWRNTTITNPKMLCSGQDADWQILLIVLGLLCLQDKVGIENGWMANGQFIFKYIISLCKVFFSLKTQFCMRLY